MTQENHDWFESLQKAFGPLQQVDPRQEEGNETVVSEAQGKQEPEREEYREDLVIQDWLEWHGMSMDERDDEGRSLMHYAADERDDEGRFLMHYAAWEGRVDIMSWLQYKGADVHATDALGRTSLSYAALGDHVEALLWLVRQGVQLSTREIPNVRYMLFQAAEHGYPEAEMQVDVWSDPAPLLFAKYDEDSVVQEWYERQELDGMEAIHQGRSLMHFAAEEGGVDLMIRLKNLGDDVNAKDNDGYTPLHGAASNNQIEAIQWLVSQGADVNVKSTHDCMPILEATINGQVEVMRCLKTHGANVKARGPGRKTLMHWAALNAHVEAMIWLKEQGVDIHARDRRGQTPMHCAADDLFLAQRTTTTRLEALAWLKAQGADINAKDKKGRTPLSMANEETTRAWMLDNDAHE